MHLLDAIGAGFHAPALAVYSSGRPLSATSVDVSHGYDTIAATATVQLTELPDWLVLRESCEVWLGYNGETVPCFNGFIEDIDRAYFPGEVTLKVSGAMALTRFPHHTKLTYGSDYTDGEMVTDLLNGCGVTEYTVDDEGYVVGTTAHPATLEAGRPISDLINAIDEVLGYKTFDTPSGVVRRRITTLPGATAGWEYVQGENILSIKRPRTIRGIYNMVVVRGISLDGQAQQSIEASAQADNPYIPTPPTYVAREFHSDLIRATAFAQTTADRMLDELNRVIEEVSLEAPGNPYLFPGLTVSVTAPGVGITAATNYWVKHVQHRMDAGGWITTLTLEGGDTTTGTPDASEADPIPVVTADVIEVGVV